MTEEGSTPAAPPEDDPLRKLFLEVLVPLVAADQGDLQWVRREGAVLYVSLGGACAGCPGRSLTVERVLLPALRRADPELKELKLSVSV